MQLHVARLCLDCEEVHDTRSCPKCSSESFALLSRWVPAPERRSRPRQPADPSASDAYRQLLTPETREDGSRWVKRGALLAAVSIGGWLWQRKFSSQPSKQGRGADEVKGQKNT